MKKNVKKTASEPRRFRVYGPMVVCGLVLISGFFIAGRQHFSSMDYGMKNSRLRKQIDELEAEKRRLILAREMSLAPSELTKVAKKVGLNAVATAELPAQEIVAKTSAKVPVSGEAKPLVVKTASIEKALPVTTTLSLKSDPIKNSVKKAVVTTAAE
ncbi:MAG: hypothetical protein JO053_09275 [Acidobacteria bacterium]|nr:hypothetical protein [Acidobacteriota bacterium]